jgi:DNA-binding NarL/FixJ family response regulator
MGPDVSVDRSILIMDDHDLFATAVCMALGEQGLSVHRVTTTHSATAILAQASAVPTGLALLDLHLGEDETGCSLDGVELIPDLRARGWTVLVVSGSRDEVREAAAIGAGAVGVVLKSASFTELLDTIRRAAAGEAVMSADTRRTWLIRHRGYQQQERELAGRLGRLSPREREVLTLLAQGFRAHQIAEQFVVELTTVRTQIRAILAKLDVNSQLEAVALLSRARERHTVATLRAVRDN